MPAHLKKGYKLTQDHYAYIYGVHANTVHRWQTRGLPLDEPRSAFLRLMIRGRCPAAVMQKGLSRILADYAAVARE